jgi:hypothetical protein
MLGPLPKRPPRPTLSSDTHATVAAAQAAATAAQAAATVDWHGQLMTAGLSEQHLAGMRLVVATPSVHRAFLLLAAVGNRGQTDHKLYDPDVASGLMCYLATAFPRLMGLPDRVDELTDELWSRQATMMRYLAVPLLFVTFFFFFLLRLTNFRRMFRTLFLNS